ncbi:MAG: SDR family NAD(P)-dependent oxidoreductase, partial [Bacteroidetes bacterium]|nr:SDR family NAD(P)-dependent oxidoreductase [Bacteroidota bacterium]
RYGNWALVAGAAEGIGEGFTTQLASCGFNIILVDQNANAMHDLAATIQQKFSVQTMELHIDLAAPDAADQCVKVSEATDCRLMVYVAAYSKVRRFIDLERSELDGFLSVNTRTLLYMVHGFSSQLISTGKTGGILLISSLAGLIGPQYVATYAATKSFIIALTEGLEGELKAHGIEITVCCAGTVSTPTYWKSKPAFDQMKPLVMQPLEVAAYALSKLGKKTICIPGLKNRFQYFILLHLLPRRVANRLVNNAMKKMYGPQIANRHSSIE